MATYALVPGADGAAWFWHLVVPRLRSRGHEVITFDLPDEDATDLDDLADVIAAAISAAPTVTRPLVLVAQSLAGFSAPLVCSRLTVDRLVLVNAMVPAPGETVEDWWGDVGQAEARVRYAAETGRHGKDAEFDLQKDFFHDVPDAVTREAFARPQRGGPPSGMWYQPWPLKAWPDVPTSFLQGREDRFFPLELQRRVARERLGLEVEEIAGGHLAALSRPDELVEALLADEA